MSYDYIIVGGGTAGCVLANRLSADLSNGARIERINWLGDLSEQRMGKSYGMLVNYIYDRRSVIKNHEDYVGKGGIATSSTISSVRR